MNGDDNKKNNRKDFIRLANKRVPNALRYIRLIGNLSNTSNYTYNEKDIDKIFKALEDALAECRQKFEKKTKKDEFCLDEENDLDDEGIDDLI